jgi:hypothetical protein
MVRNPDVFSSAQPDPLQGIRKEQEVRDFKRAHVFDRWYVFASFFAAVLALLLGVIPAILDGMGELGAYSPDVLSLSLFAVVACVLMGLTFGFAALFSRGQISVPAVLGILTNQLLLAALCRLCANPTLW